MLPVRVTSTVTASVPGNLYDHTPPGNSWEKQILSLIASGSSSEPASSGADCSKRTSRASSPQFQQTNSFHLFFPRLHYLNSRRRVCPAHDAGELVRCDGPIQTSGTCSSAVPRHEMGPSCGGSALHLPAVHELTPFIKRNGSLLAAPSTESQRTRLEGPPRSVLRRKSLAGTEPCRL